MAELECFGNKLNLHHFHLTRDSVYVYIWFHLKKKKRIIHPKVEFSHVPCDYAKSD